MAPPAPRALPGHFSWPFRGQGRLRLRATARCMSLLNHHQGPSPVPGAPHWHPRASLGKAQPCFPPLVLCLCLTGAAITEASSPESPARPRTDLPLAAFYDDELLLRRGPGKHNLGVVLQNVVQLLRGHVLQVTAMDHAGLGVSRIRTRRKKVTHHTSPVRRLSPTGYVVT